MKPTRIAALAACLALGMGTANLWAQGAGGGSGAPSNNPPGTPTNNAGNPAPGGKPAGTGSSSTGSPTKTDSMDKPSTGKPDKAMRPGRAGSASAGGASMPKP